MVEDLIVEEGTCVGVVTKTGAEYRAKTIVLTTGTYLRGKIIMGELMYESGPNNQQPAIKLSESLKRNGLQLADSRRVRRRGYMRIRSISAKPKFSRAITIRNISPMKRNIWRMPKSSFHAG